MNWLQYFMQFAWHASKKSKDPNTKVGAIAVNPVSHRLLETGFNGLPRGVRDLPERMERPVKYHWTGHAEENLVAHAARDRLEGATVYVTHFCCAGCARMLINAGVSRIVVGGGTTSMPREQFEIAATMFSEAGVIVDGGDLIEVQKGE